MSPGFSYRCIAAKAPRSTARCPCKLCSELLILFVCSSPLWSTLPPALLILIKRTLVRPDIRCRICMPYSCTHNACSYLIHSVSLMHASRNATHVHLRKVGAYSIFNAMDIYPAARSMYKSQEKKEFMDESASIDASTCIPLSFKTEKRRVKQKKLKRRVRKHTRYYELDDWVHLPPDRRDSIDYYSDLDD